LFRRLRAFPQDRGLRYIAELNIERLRSFRSSWPDHNLSALKKLERLRAFFRFCQESKWIDDNPARLLKNPKITQPSTLSFSRDQVAGIVSACLNLSGPQQRSARAWFSAFAEVQRTADSRCGDA
jgi:site-specific recombinase XerD